jgi:hypothetical protein|tara:strand:+ start:666 stop:941 length:276 start_codon:yes stop_codon:yes gene_type:complete
MTTTFKFIDSLDDIEINEEIAEALDQLQLITKNALTNEETKAWDLVIALLIQVASLTRMKELDRDVVMSTLWFMTMQASEFELNQEKIVKH